MTIEQSVASMQVVIELGRVIRDRKVMPVKVLYVIWCVSPCVVLYCITVYVCVCNCVCVRVCVYVCVLSRHSVFAVSSARDSGYSQGSISQGSCDLTEELHTGGKSIQYNKQEFV